MQTDSKPAKLGNFFKVKANEFVQTHLTEDTSSSLLKNGVYQIQYDSQSLYIGEMNENQQKQGKGVYQYSNKDIFLGDWKRDEMDGDGKYLFSSGQVCEGCFSYGQIRQGKIEYENGDYYEGSFESNERSGYGRMVCKHKNQKNVDQFYEGQWKNDMRHGKGSLRQGKLVINGEWENNKLNGYSLLKDNNFQYKGIVSQNKLMKGKIKINYSQNSYYEGQIYKNKRDGSGVYYFSDSFVYRGQLSNNNLHGKGILETDKGCYEGQFRDNLPNGKGKFTYKNGDTYEGDWVNGKKEGLGLFKNGKGHWHEGEYHNDKRNGFGRYYWPDVQTLFEGHFENDNTSKGSFKKVKIMDKN